MSVVDGEEFDDVIGRRGAPAPESDEHVVSLSPLAALAEEIAEEERQADEDGESIVVLEVPRRPGWAVHCKAVVTYPQMRAWQKRARDSDGIDELKLAALIIAHTNRAVMKDDEHLGEHGETVTFRDAPLKDVLKAKDAPEAVVRLYGNDFHVGVAANKVLSEAGMGQDVAAFAREDPTRR